MIYFPRDERKVMGILFCVTVTIFLFVFYWVPFLVFDEHDVHVFRKGPPVRVPKYNPPDVVNAWKRKEFQDVYDTTFIPIWIEYFDTMRSYNDIVELKFEISINVLNSTYPLEQNKDYLLTNFPYCCGLQSLNGRWLNLDNLTYPASVVLHSMRKDSNSPNILNQSLTFAHMYPTPSFIEYDQIIHFSTEEITIRGRNLIGMKSLWLQFNSNDPKFDIISSFPLTKNEITVRRRSGTFWNYWFENGNLVKNVGSLDLEAFGSEWHVAYVFPDSIPERTGGVDVYQTSRAIYESTKQFYIHGCGFKAGITFEFNPPITLGVHYDLIIESENKVLLKLKPSKKWPMEFWWRPLSVVAVSIDNQIYSLAGRLYNDSISNHNIVAIVHRNPVIKLPDVKYFENYTESIFVLIETRRRLKSISIYPTPPDAYKLIYHYYKDDVDRYEFRLLSNKSWMTSNQKGGVNGVPFQILSLVTELDTVVFDEPVTIGYIKKEHVSYLLPSDQIISINASEITIKGVGLIGLKKIDLWIVGGVRIEIVSSFPLISDEIVIRLKGKFWGLHTVCGGSGCHGFVTPGDVVLQYSFPEMSNKKLSRIIIAYTVLNDASDTGGVQIVNLDSNIPTISDTVSKFFIRGSGFKDGISFAFDPPMIQGVDYDMEIESPNQIILHLKPGMKWLKAFTNKLKVTSVNVDGVDYVLGHREYVTSSDGLEISSKFDNGVTVARVSEGLSLNVNS